MKEEGWSNENLSAAWFLQLCNGWFDIMSSRYPVVALSRVDPDKHKEAVSFLMSVVTAFKSLKIGERGGWKPVQSGVLMAIH